MIQPHFSAEGATTIQHSDDLLSPGEAAAVHTTTGTITCDEQNTRLIFQASLCRYKLTAFLTCSPFPPTIRPNSRGNAVVRRRTQVYSLCSAQVLNFESLSGRITSKEASGGGWGRGRNGHDHKPASTNASWRSSYPATRKPRSNRGRRYMWYVMILKTSIV